MSRVKLSWKKILVLVMVLIAAVALFGIKQQQKAKSTQIERSNRQVVLKITDYGTLSCKCQETPESIRKVENAYKQVISFSYVDMLSAAQAGIYDQPTQIIFDAENKELARHEGAMTEDSFTELIESLLSKSGS